eukprot:9134547-Pyramimonas_sp.AAC.1
MRRPRAHWRAPPPWSEGRGRLRAARASPTPQQPSSRRPSPTPPHPAFRPRCLASGPRCLCPALQAGSPSPATLSCAARDLLWRAETLAARGRDARLSA